MYVITLGDDSASRYSKTELHPATARAAPWRWGRWRPQAHWGGWPETPTTQIQAPPTHSTEKYRQPGSAGQEINASSFTPCKHFIFPWRWHWEEGILNDTKGVFLFWLFKKQKKKKPFRSVINKGKRKAPKPHNCLSGHSSSPKSASYAIHPHTGKCPYNEPQKNYSTVKKAPYPLPTTKNHPQISKYS